MRFSTCVAWVVVLLVVGSALAQKPGKMPGQKPGDPMGDNFFPPDLLMREADAIGLTDEQKQFLQGELQTMKSRFSDFQQQLQKEVQALAELLSAESVDEQKALEQMDKVLEQEREIKREHVKLLVSIKNKLTAEQQAKAREIKAKLMAQKGQGKAPPPSLPPKMQQVQTILKEWKQKGRDLSAVAPMMQELDPLMREGKFAEAEAIIDKMLDVLNKEP